MSLFPDKPMFRNITLVSLSPAGNFEKHMAFPISCLPPFPSRIIFRMIITALKTISRFTIANGLATITAVHFRSPICCSKMFTTIRTIFGITRFFNKMLSTSSAIDIFLLRKFEMTCPASYRFWLASHKRYPSFLPASLACMPYEFMSIIFANLPSKFMCLFNLPNSRHSNSFLRNLIPLTYIITCGG